MSLECDATLGSATHCVPSPARRSARDGQLAPICRLLRDRERRRERLETDAGSMANRVQALAEEAAPQDASQRQYDSRDQTFLAYCQSQSPGNSLP